MLLHHRRCSNFIFRVPHCFFSITEMCKFSEVPTVLNIPSGYHVFLLLCLFLCGKSFLSCLPCVSFWQATITSWFLIFQIVFSVCLHPAGRSLSPATRNTMYSRTNLRRSCRTDSQVCHSTSPAGQSLLPAELPSPTPLIITHDLQAISDDGHLPSHKYSCSLNLDLASNTLNFDSGCPGSSLAPQISATLYSGCFFSITDR